MTLIIKAGATNMTEGQADCSGLLHAVENASFVVVPSLEVMAALIKQWP